MYIHFTLDIRRFQGFPSIELRLGLPLHPGSKKKKKPTYDTGSRTSSMQVNLVSLIDKGVAFYAKIYTGVTIHTCREKLTWYKRNLS